MKVLSPGPRNRVRSTDRNVLRGLLTKNVNGTQVSVGEGAQVVFVGHVAHVE